MIWIFRIEIFSCFYIVALKKTFYCGAKQRDAFLRLLFPHISDSLLFDYLTAIFMVFPSSCFSVALIIFQIFLANEIPVYYPLECFFSSYHIQVTTNLHRNRKIKVMKSAVCAYTRFRYMQSGFLNRKFFSFLKGSFENFCSVTNRKQRNGHF